MGIVEKIKPGLDLPSWQQCPPLATAHAAATQLICDKRNNTHADPALYYMQDSGTVSRYSPWYNGPLQVTGALGLIASTAGADAKIGVLPIYGVLAAGCSTTKLVSSTALFAGAAISSVGANSLIRTDMPEAYEVKVIGYAAGKTEYRTLTAHTTSATPTWYLDEPLSFTPAANDRYEILSAGLLAIGPGTTGTTQSKALCLATGTTPTGWGTGVTISGNGTSSIVRDEQYVPYDMMPGEGMIPGTSTYDTDPDYGNDLRCLIATATSGTTITSAALDAEYTFNTNDYRNFVVRIVEDTTTPTAVGQRRAIASTTSGTTPQITVGTAWTVTPSATAKFVIENPNIWFVQNAVQAGFLTFNYSDQAYNNGTFTINPFTWSTTAFAGAVVHAAAVNLGTCAANCSFHRPIRQADGTRLSSHGGMWFFRGNGNVLDYFDMSAGTGGTWTNAFNYGPIQGNLGAGACMDNDSGTWLGEYAYLVFNATNTVFQFNVATPSLAPWAKLPVQSGTAALGNRIAVTINVPAEPLAWNLTVTPEDKLSTVFVQSHLSTLLHRSDVIS